MRMSLKLYRLLLKLYPASFRENYEGPLERDFQDEYAQTTGAAAIVGLWMRTALDVAASAPPQIFREFLQDARHALRVWGKRPVHTAFAIAALAIGIGANTGVFSVLNALLLRSLPFREPDRLAALPMFSPTPLTGHVAEFHAWRTHSRYLEDAARFNSSEVNLDGAHEGMRVRLTETSSNFFSLLGCRPPWGRGFAPGEDTPGRDGVAVIGYGLWQEFFGGDRNALGRTIRVNGAPLTIVGIAPPEFDYPQRTAIWAPTSFDWDRIPKEGPNFLQIIGRLKAGVTWAQARQAFKAEASGQWSPMGGAAGPPPLSPIQEQLAGPVKRASLILMAGAALILLMACLNLANLLLARTLDRSNEMTIRAALGASRARLIQQLLTESVCAALLAAVAGLLVAAWAERLASAVQPAPLAEQAYTILDWRVLAFALGVAVLTGIAFGVLPALSIGRARGSSMLIRSAAAGPRTARTRNVLMAAQVALTIVLLTSSIALGRAFLGLLRVDNGYAVRNIITMSVSLAGSPYEKDDRALAWYDEVMRRVRAVPGVVSASATEFLPLNSTAYMGGEFPFAGAPTGRFALLLRVMPDFFQTMGGRVLRGREFQTRDLKAGVSVAVVSDEFARNSGDPRSVVGRTLMIFGRPATVVG